LSKHSEGVLFSQGLILHNVRSGEFPETKRRERLGVTKKTITSGKGNKETKKAKMNGKKINQRNDTNKSGKVSAKQLQMEHSFI